MSSRGDQIQIVLEIERGSVPLAGWVKGSQGEARNFIGWTGLAATLSIVLDEAELRASPQREV